MSDVWLCLAVLRSSPYHPSEVFAAGDALPRQSQPPPSLKITVNARLFAPVMKTRDAEAAIRGHLLSVTCDPGVCLSTLDCPH